MYTHTHIHVYIMYTYIYKLTHGSSSEECLLASVQSEIGGFPIIRRVVDSRHTDVLIKAGNHGFCVCACVYVYIHMYIYMYVYRVIHICMYTHVYIG